ncbi:glycosyltransferase family 10 protein [Linnemannia elongata AG-77]|uniref:Glycosyltransferase family 10 protein n=1 Tax=Linnemannia elongata AG-77 TaxID=1314771 RepID=A0A197JB29_9FUNG|nr:glycosyltransferase family 10 protein [Linnemannia elongata AG-77]
MEAMVQKWRGSILDAVLAPLPVTLEYKKAMRKEELNGGKGLVPIVWIVSNYHASNGREYYVRQLQKYIDIDIMNSTCDFYGAEKLKRTYEAATIPIIDEPNDCGLFAATHNALTHADQSSPKQMEALVKELGENDDTYQERLRYEYLKDPTYKPTLSDLSPIFVKQWTNGNQGTDFLAWPSVYDESMCRSCKLAQDVSKGIVKLDLIKRLVPNAKCLEKRHLHFTWMVEYHWR